MGEPEFSEVKKELYREVDELRREAAAFKGRVSLIANLLIPGFGFFVFGQEYLKGFIALGLHILYNLFFFYRILPNTDFGVALIYYIPALLIWAVSSMMVAGLED